MAKLLIRRENQACHPSPPSPRGRDFDRGKEAYYGEQESLSWAADRELSHHRGNCFRSLWECVSCSAPPAHWAPSGHQASPFLSGLGKGTNPVPSRGPVSRNVTAPLYPAHPRYRLHRGHAFPGGRVCSWWLPAEAAPATRSAFPLANGTDHPLPDWRGVAACSRTADHSS